MSNNKKIILALIALFALFAGTHIFQNETRAQEEPLVVPDAVPAEGGGSGNQAGREILALLADMKSIKLDASIFFDPAFQSLVDTTVKLNEELKGRPNPFAPIGKDIVLSDDFSAFATTGPRDISFTSDASVGGKTKSKTTSSPAVIPIGIGI